MEKQVNEYLKNLLTHIDVPPMSAEDKANAEQDILHFIVNKITRKKFRRRKLAPQTRDAIEKKVKESVEKQIPVHLVVPFGGYKHFWNPSHPEPDWAELFNFRYLTDLVLPVLSVYKPGVVIEYVSEDMILNRMNNYSQNALEGYSKIFKELVTWYNKHIPNNLECRYFRVGDKVDKTALIKKVESLLPERRKEFESLSKEEKDKELHRSYRSMNWKGDLDLTSLNDSEKNARVIESRLIELAYYDTEAEPEFLCDYLWRDNHICICFSFGTTHDNDELQDLTLGSTYGSIVDYWIGRGILEKRGERFIPDIISKTQYEAQKEKFSVVNTTRFLPFTNYQTIEVLKE